MMIGELEANDFLIYGNGNDNKVASCIFVTFMMFVNIVIANLLVGLAITEMKKLFLKAEMLRLEATTYLLNELQSGNFLYRKRRHSFFRYIRNSRKGDSMPWKICVLPNTEKFVTYQGCGINMLRFYTLNPNEMAREKLYDVYLYNENYPKPVPEMKLDKITIPARIVNNALEILKRRNERKEMGLSSESNVSSLSVDHQIIRQNSKTNSDSYFQSKKFVDKLNGFAVILNMSPISSENFDVSTPLVSETVEV